MLASVPPFSFECDRDAILPYVCRPFNFKMAADSDVEISVDDVCESVTDGHGGVEVETIMEGQATPGSDLDFIVQEEVETTTDGVVVSAGDLDPVDNVIIALQNTEQDAAVGVGHFQELGMMKEGETEDVPEIEYALPVRRRKGNSKSSSNSPRKRVRKSRKGVRFINRKIPVALATSQSVKDAKEANEVSFDPQKRPRKWSRAALPVRTVNGGEFTVQLWTTGTYCGWTPSL